MSNIVLNSDNQLDVDALTAWMMLEYTPRLPLEAIRVWLSAFGSSTAVLEASISQLSELATETAALALKNANNTVKEQRQTHINKALAWLNIDHNDSTRHILTWDNPAYPKILLTLPDPPLILCVQGQVESFNQNALAVVGSRTATQQGISNAHLFSHALAEHALTIISGLALGIDAAAHEGALLATNNPYATIAVVGTGIDRVYPSTHRHLAHKIANQGAIVSEFPVGTPPIHYNFPRRNRLIAALSKGVLVIEAAQRSGSLITARVAGEQGREVFAIPGSIHAPLSKGCHHLIKQGATLVESAHDVLEVLGFIKPEKIDNEERLILNKHIHQTTKQTNNQSLKNKPLKPTVKEAIVFKNDELLTDDVVLNAFLNESTLKQHANIALDLDTLLLLTQLSTGELLAHLIQLELLGDIEMIEGGRYRRLL